MAVAFYFDVPVNKAIAVGLRLRGLEVITAQEDGYSTASDEEIMMRATKLNRPVVTADHDFLVKVLLYGIRPRTWKSLFISIASQGY